jgi:transcriptional regulator with XRE-family HTH domain
MRRKMLAMSQEKLAKALRLTFQQVQKYEKGTNRIGGSRLQQMSHILQVPVAFFFEDVPGASAMSKSDKTALPLAHVDDFVSSSDGLRLIRAFTRIKSATLRQRRANRLPPDFPTAFGEVAPHRSARPARLSRIERRRQS